MTLADALPTMNAAFNATTAVLLVLGFRAIRSRRIARHRALMLGALASSLLFLAGYVTRLALTGTHAFPGTGAFRATYLAVLASHTMFAVVAAPLVLRTLFLAWKARFPKHRRIARVTFPVWLYVSATGVAVYVMLYHLAPHGP